MSEFTPSSRTLRPYYVAPSPEDFLDAPALSGATARHAGGRPTSYATVHDLLEDEPGPSTVSEYVRVYSSAALLGYLSTACVMPFEVGKVLLQVQWIPKADVELLNEDTDEEAEGEGEGDDDDRIYNVDDLEDEDEVEAYFHDLNANPQQRTARTRRPGAAGGRQHRESRRGRAAGAGPNDEYNPFASSSGYATPPTNAATAGPLLSVTSATPRKGQQDGPDGAAARTGYITRRTIFEQATKPDWILPFTVTGGVWDMMKAIGRWKSEGWLALWKGQTVTFVLESLSSAIQPAFFSVLASIFLRDVPFSTLPLVHIPNPIKPFIVTIISHVVTGVLLSPLDLIRTRLIVQSSLPRHRKYSGPIDAYTQLSAEEGGLLTNYTHTSLVVPAVLESLFRSVFNVGLPLFLERRLHISLDGNPVVYGLAEFTLSTAALLVTLPIETVRRRLQIQSRAQLTGVKGRRSLKTCVETRPTPYAGVVETVYRILTEETGKLHLHNREQKPRRPSMSSRRSSTSGAARSPSPSTRRRPSFMRGSTSAAGPSFRSAAGVPPATPAREMGEWEAQARAQDDQRELRTQDASSNIPPTNDNLSADNINPLDLVIDNSEPVAAPSLPLLAGVTQLYRGFSLGLGANFIVLVLGLVAGKERYGGMGGGMTGNGWTEM